MSCYIILNGEPIFDVSLPNDAFVIATDGALEFCNKVGINCNKVVGDFDSLGYVPKDSIVYPKDKDLTDGEIALITAKNLGFNEVVFLCFGGLRDDHFLCNLSLLEIASQMGISAYAETVYSKIYLTDDLLELNESAGQTISILAVSDVAKLTSCGLKYEYNCRELKRASTLGVSNVAKSGLVKIKVLSGKVLVIINKVKK